MVNLDIISQSVYKDVLFELKCPGVHGENLLHGERSALVQVSVVIHSSSRRAQSVSVCYIEPAVTHTELRDEMTAGDRKGFLQGLSSCLLLLLHEALNKNDK